MVHDKDSSVSHKDSRYVDAVELALANEAVFRNFRRFDAYMGIVEHGAEVFERSRRALSKTMLENIEKVSSIDYVGNPVLYEGLVKPMSAKVVKVARVVDDLISFLGDDLNGMLVTEIGAGFGAQFKAINDFFDAPYIFIDLACVNRLIRKCIEVWHSCSWKHGLAFDFIDYEALDEYGDVHSDLVISNYGVSECRRELQEKYIKKVCVGARFGYVLYNTVSGLDVMTAKEFASRVPGAKVWSRKEYDDGEGVNLITWGKTWKR